MNNETDTKVDQNTKVARARRAYDKTTTEQTRATAVEAAYAEYNGICDNDPLILKANRDDLLRHAKLAATRTSDITGYSIGWLMNREGNVQFR